VRAADPGRRDEEDDMEWIGVATPPLTTVEQFDAVIARTGEPEGLEARWCARTEGGELRIVTVWASKEDADRFFAEQLGPVLAQVIGPEPQGPSEMLGLEVLRSWVPAAVG
jgi:hypothetical protein